MHLFSYLEGFSYINTHDIIYYTGLTTNMEYFQATYLLTRRLRKIKMNVL